MRVSQSTTEATGKSSRPDSERVSLWSQRVSKRCRRGHEGGHTHSIDWCLSGRCTHLCSKSCGCSWSSSAYCDGTVLAVSVMPTRSASLDDNGTYKGSVCSPNPYRCGLCGSCVLKRRYCDSKTVLLPDVLESTSPLLLLVMAKEKGSTTQLKSMAACSLLPLLPSGL